MARKGPEPSSTDPPRGRRAAHVALIVLAAGATFANALDNGFHLDDFYRIVDNPGIAADVPIWRHFVDPTTVATVDRLVDYRPLLPLTLSVSRSISGDAPRSYRLGNLLAHTASAAILYLVVLGMLRRTRGARSSPRQSIPSNSDETVALGAALLFAVHPVSGVVVNYLCARDLALMQLFLLASLGGYVSIAARGGSRARWALVMGALGLSLLSKTNAVVAPAVFLAYEVTIERRRLLEPRAWRPVLPAVAVVGLYFVVATLAMGGPPWRNVVANEAVSSWVYALTQLRLHLVHYARNFVWPFSMRMGPAIEAAGGLLEPGVVAGAVLVAATLALAWWARRRSPVIAFCILAYWILMVPESSVSPFHHLAVDYRAYASSPFLYVAVAVAAVSGLGRRAAAVLIAVAVVSAASASVALNRSWRTERTLWERSVRLGGDALAHTSYAMSFDDPTDPRVREHLERAIELEPEFATAHLNLGLALLASGETERGLAELRRSAELGPTRPESHLFLARGYAGAGRPREAYAAVLEAVRLRPGDAEMLLEAARLARDAGAPAEAAELERRARATLSGTSPPTAP